MNIALIQPPAMQLTEPSRPAQHPAPESSRPVLEPTRVDASAQQVRSDEERGDSPEAGPRADTHARPDAVQRGGNAQDPMVGAILDVFA